MPAFKMRTVETHYVDAEDLEAFVQEVYGAEMEIAASEEASNGTNLIVKVDSDMMPTYYESDAHRLIVGDWVGYGVTAVALHLLCRDKYINPGTYCVQVSW